MKSQYHSWYSDVRPTSQAVRGEMVRSSNGDDTCSIISLG